MSSRKYFVFNYPATVAGNTFLTGIRRTSSSRKDQVYISGFFTEQSGPLVIAFVYKGSLSGKGKFYVLQFPSSTGVTVTSTNLYGPNNAPRRGQIRVVGNFTTSEAGSSALGCLYEGKLDGSGTWTQLLPSFPSVTVLNTIAHSTMGRLVVGNYDTSLATGKAFIYDITTQEYFDIIKPGAVSITAYGIWHNGGRHYTICGGFANIGSPAIGSSYLVDWNNKTRTFYNWRIYWYNNDPTNSIITHFDGITTDSHGGYYLTGDWVSVGGSTYAFFCHVRRSGVASWSLVAYPNQTLTSGNSVYKRNVIGVFVDTSTSLSNGYISTA